MKKLGAFLAALALSLMLAACAGGAVGGAPDTADIGEETQTSPEAGEAPPEADQTWTEADQTWTEADQAGTESGQTGTESDQAGRKYADGQTLKLIYDDEANTLNYLVSSDSNTLTIGANCIDPLVEYDRDGNIVPAGAESYEVSPDGLTWTFRLRDGQYWYDCEMNRMEPVTANDYVAALLYVLDAANDADGVDSVLGVVANAAEYHEYTRVALLGFKNSAGETLDSNPDENPDAAAVAEVLPEDVGIKATDGLTLVYTLSSPCAYFASIVQNAAYWPAPSTLIGNAETPFARDNGSMWYNGAYVLSSFKTRTEHIFTKNENYHDAGSVYITTVTETYHEDAETLAPGMFVGGEIDYYSIGADELDIWLENDAADVIKTRENGESYFFSFNFEPLFDDEYEPDNWRNAVSNENFRKAVFYGLDRLGALEAAYSGEAEDYIESCFTPKGALLCGGLDYTGFGALAELSGSAGYDSALALQYMESAKAELEKEGCTFPIKILMPYDSSDFYWGCEAVAIEAQLEELFGTDTVDVIIESYVGRSFLGDTRRAGNYGLMRCSWRADCADPEAWTVPFVTGNSYGYAYDTIELFKKSTKPLAVREADKEYNGLVEAAKAVMNDTSARYEAFAKAEAYYIEHAMAIPYASTGVSCEATRLDPFEGQFAPAGSSLMRFKGLHVYQTALTEAEFETEYALWSASTGLE